MKIPFETLSVFIADAEGFIAKEKGKSIPENRAILTRIADNIIRIKVADMLDVPVSSVEVEKDKQGAPFLPRYKGIHISKSYTERHAVCAISTDRVGIDIEKIHAPSPKIAGRLYSETELEDIFGKTKPTAADYEHAKDDLDVCKRWTKLWTIKEAYGKCIGTGLMTFRQNALGVLSRCSANHLVTVDIPVSEEFLCSVVSRYSNVTVLEIVSKDLLKKDG